MSKLKQMVMDQEQRFWEIAESTIFKSKSRIDFVSKMNKHFHLMRPMSDQEIYSVLSDYSEGFNWEEDND